MLLLVFSWFNWIKIHLCHFNFLIQVLNTKWNWGLNKYISIFLLDSGLVITPSDPCFVIKIMIDVCSLLYFRFDKIFEKKLCKKLCKWNFRNIEIFNSPFESKVLAQTSFYFFFFYFKNMLLFINYVQIKVERKILEI